MAGTSNFKIYRLHDDGLKCSTVEQSKAFGRYINSVGEEQFPAQSATTFGTPNAGPRVGPVVIREIQYNPGPGGDEFLELANLTDAPIPLFDPGNPTQ